MLGYLTTDENFQSEHKFAGVEGNWKVLNHKHLHRLQNLYFDLNDEKLVYRY